MKKRIFIGSSKESLPVANIVEQYFKGKQYECIVWNESFFELNDSALDNLIKKAGSFDYAVLIGGKDDFGRRLSNGKKKFMPRDNIYFELGLFMGILSKYRTYLLADEAVKLATDLLGITVKWYANTTDVDKLKKSVKAACASIFDKMKNEEKVNRIQLLPSVSLAYGYYENFLKPLGEEKLKLRQVKLEGIDYNVKKIDVHVILPDTVIEDWRKWSEDFYYKNGVVNLDFENSLRRYSIHIKPDELKNSGTLKIVEVPQTLRSSFGAVDVIIGEGAVGTSELQIKMKEKERNTFKYTLEVLISKDTHVKNMATVEIVSNDTII